VLSKGEDAHTLRKFALTPHCRQKTVRGYRGGGWDVGDPEIARDSAARPRDRPRLREIDPRSRGAARGEVDGLGARGRK